VEGNKRKRRGWGISGDLLGDGYHLTWELTHAQQLCSLVKAVARPGLFFFSCIQWASVAEFRAQFSTIHWPAHSSSALSVYLELTVVVPMKLSNVSFLNGVKLFTIDFCSVTNLYIRFYWQWWLHFVGSYAH
jgi:hypothetical protein